MENKKIQAALGEEELLTVSGGTGTAAPVPAPKYQVGQRIKAKSPYLSSTPDWTPYVEGVIVEVTDFYLPTRGQAYWVELEHNGKMERAGIYENDIVDLC